MDMNVFYPPCLADPEEDCRVPRSVYEIECQNCKQGGRKSQYFGTSGHVLHKRLREHCTDLAGGRRSNAMVKHKMTEHPNSQVTFHAKPVRGQIKFNVDRYIRESQAIYKASLDPSINLLNQRSEWGHRGVPRLQIAPQWDFSQQISGKMIKYTHAPTHRLLGSFTIL